MLTLFTGGQGRDCEGMTRRSFVQAGTLGLGGLTLQSLLQAKANAGQAGAELVKDKAVVVLFLSGGATHVETFDPKMSAPAEYRSMTGEVATKIPGVTIGGGFPEIATMADRMAFVRSFRHGSSSHGRGRELVLSGGNTLKASMGSIYSRLAGPTNPKTGLPNYSLVTPAGADAKFRQGDSIGSAGQAGLLGGAYNPFDPSKGSEVKQNMRLNMPVDRLDDRRALLGQLDGLKRQLDASPGYEGSDKFQKQAFDVVLGGAADAFDLKKEDPKLVDRYSTEKFKDLKGKGLGHQMLLARKLVEAGVGFVNVSSGGWDMHRGLVKAMDTYGHSVDHAVATFLTDLESRGLSDKVLLIITGEFGRTPRINKNAGRDHWGNLCTLALAGGGLKMGQVIGESDRKVSVPAQSPVSVQDLMGTVVNLMVDVPAMRLLADIPVELTQFIGQGRPIPQLV